MQNFSASFLIPGFPVFMSKFFLNIFIYQDFRPSCPNATFFLHLFLLVDFLPSFPNLTFSSIFSYFRISCIPVRMQPFSTFFLISEFPAFLSGCNVFLRFFSFQNFLPSCPDVSFSYIFSYFRISCLPVRMQPFPTSFLLLLNVIFIISASSAHLLESKYYN